MSRPQWPGGAFACHPFLRAILLAGLVLWAGSAVSAGESTITEQRIRTGVERSLVWLERSTHRSLSQRKQCFTCHNQGLPMMVLAAAHQRGIVVDSGELQRQAVATEAFLARNRAGYLAGKGQAGQVFMAGYALWALDSVGWDRNETTAAVAEYFLKSHADSDHWTTKTQRPPSEGSPFAATFLGLMSLDRFGTPEQQPRIESRRQAVRDWLRQTSAEETEDRVFRLWGLHAAGSDADDIRKAADELLVSQHSSGGWSQRESMEADAYATGTALCVLHQTGSLKDRGPHYQRGLRYLLDTQNDDGTWYVQSRSIPFQSYYESGYPFGDDQFISMSAASWATLALTFALPEIDVPPALHSND